MNNMFPKQLPEFISNRLLFQVEDLIHSNKSKTHLVMGKVPESNSIIMQSNDYLSIANHPKIKQVHTDAINKCDASVVMSAIFLQSERSKPNFEKQLASYTGMPSCLLSQSGWAANIGLLQTICAPTTPVYIDFFTHMSLWEGARIADAAIHPFMHNNLNHLIKQVERYGAGIIIVDSVYSTIGTVAPLKELCDIAERYGCAIIVDESHSLGTHGPQGAGLVKELELTDKVDFITVSLAKSFAYRAGAILGHDLISQTLPFVAYPAIFSSALLPYEIDRLEKTLEIVRGSDEKRAQVERLARQLRQGLKQIGFQVRSQSQIVAIETADERNTEHVRDYLEDNGIFGSVFCRPATGKNKNIIRFSINASLSEQDIEKTIEVCRSAYQSGQFIFV